MRVQCIHTIVRVDILFLIFAIFSCVVVIGPKDTVAEDVVHVSFADYEKYLPYIYASERV